MTTEVPASSLSAPHAAIEASAGRGPWELQGMPSVARPGIAVVVKRRRALDRSALPHVMTAQSRSEAAATAPNGERKPRVFTIPGEPRAQGDAEVDSPAPLATVAVRRSRRRVDVLRRPGKVVSIAAVQDDRIAETNGHDGSASWLSLPEVDGYRSVCDALAGVRALLDQAAAARRLRFRASAGR